MTATKISLGQLESFLLKAADTLRGSMDPSEYKEFIFGMLFIKRMSDEFDKKREELKRKYAHLNDDVVAELLEDKNLYGDTFFIPKMSRWNEGYTDDNGEYHPPLKDAKENIGERLNKAIDGIEENNDVLNGVLKNNINFNKTTGNNKRISDSTWKDLIDHFNNPNLILVNDNFEFPDLLGAAYEYLIKFFADSAGKKAGEFYTPGEVVRLLVQLIKPQKGMQVYDPTVGSGGMLIQSAQYIEESGANLRDVALYGQEKAGTVWAICKMNMILHNRPDAHIEHGDTIEEPQILDNGTIRKFDRVIANPPFSQNYNRDNTKFGFRFHYGWAPESSKKADFMFVEHMIASLKPKGIMATIMPHGVLFRGGQEKVIREAIVDGNIIEAIIGLPQGLFYGTGIPACVLVINRNKPDELKDKIFFINAEAEYEEGKNQNKLRQEDIEKIDFVFTNKREIPKYSKLVGKGEIVDNDYSLNIRRYVDNTPEPEPEDVKAHLVGGVPKSEVEMKKVAFHKFGIDPLVLLEEKNTDYYSFREEIDHIEKIKTLIESDVSVIETCDKMHQTIQRWWVEAKNDFSQIANGPENGTKISEIRSQLLNSIKQELTELEVLDEFQSAGVFVNWWKNIRYDLKTISSSGWSPMLIPDELLTDTFFRDEKKEIEAIESNLTHEEYLLTEAIENVEYEPDEDEKVTNKVIRDYLASEIKELEGATKESAIKEKKILEDQLNEIRKRESTIRKCKKELKEKQEDLEFKLEVKRHGLEGSEYRLRLLKKQAHDQIDELEKIEESDAKEERKRKRKISALEKDIKVLDEKLDGLRQLFESIGGMITEEESKDLILLKHFSLINTELDRYLSQEQRALVSVFENYWDKYAVSMQLLIKQRNEVKQELDKFLEELRYYG